MTENETTEIKPSNESDNLIIEDVEEVTPEEKMENRATDVSQTEDLEELQQNEETIASAPTPAIDNFVESSDQSLTEQLSKIAGTLNVLVNKADELSVQVSEKIRVTDRDTRIIIDMDAELKKYKDDFYIKLFKPILTDLIDFRDSMIKYANKRKEMVDSENTIPLKTFESYSYDIMDIIERYGVTSYNANSGDDFTPIKQKALKKITTTDESLHGKVAASLNPGYVLNDKIIKPETIAIYVYEKPEPVENDASTNSSVSETPSSEVTGGMKIM